MRRGDGVRPTTEDTHQLLSRSLAMATPGEMLQVDEVYFDAVQRRFRYFGIEPGAFLLCRGRCHRWVEVLAGTGKVVRVPLHFACFISVESV